MHHNLPKKSLKTYWPLILVLIFIVGGMFHFSWLRGEHNLWMTDFSDSFSSRNWMIDFMGLFFLVFSFFKLLDLKSFADAYRSYDIPTKIFPVWGYVYPFVELGLAMMYLHRIELLLANVITVFVLGISIVGVIQSVMQKRKIKCACLGTGFNLPMSQITIIEDVIMILMALFMLIG